jgi:hypothetical protein
MLDNMNKEFITYNQALALKELGFDEPCIKYYWTDGMFVKGYEEPFNYNKRDNVISAPLYQQAFRWFREKHKQDSLVVPSGDSTGKTNGYYYEIVFDFSKENIESESFKTYEEAESACLDKLIEIIKNRKK